MSTGNWKQKTRTHTQEECHEQDEDHGRVLRESHWDRAGADGRPPGGRGTPRAFPSWDGKINSPGRFKVLGDFAGAAVLDRETGLVWEQSPDTTSTQTWFNALVHCYQRVVAGRLGWRVPTIEELASLIDPNNPGGNPDLPPGHPFSNVQSGHYWSATTTADTPSNAWDVDLTTGVVDGVVKTALDFVWCVRGGQGIDGVQ